MISLYVEMNGHLILGLCIWSKFFVGFFFKHNFLAVAKTSFALTCLYLIFGLMGEKKKKNNQKIINQKKINQGWQEAKLCLCQGPAQTVVFSVATDDGDTGENRKPSLGLVPDPAEKQ